MRPVICDRKGPMPKEEDQTTVASESDITTPNLLASSNVFAFAGGSQPMRTTLGPRSAVDPVQVWVGLNPPSQAELAAQAAAEEAAAKAQQAKKQQKKKVRTADDKA
ncbi:hypothetical protein HI113_45865, partial [Corallococcus exiguus]|uniref:hypothetical protein n=1 Tax=Corallococcus exiguus TaxID=83462 RepID=UPI0017DE5817